VGVKDVEAPRAFAVDVRASESSTVACLTALTFAISSEKPAEVRRDKAKGVATTTLILAMEAPRERTPAPKAFSRLAERFSEATSLLSVADSSMKAAPARIERGEGMRGRSLRIAVL